MVWALEYVTCPGLFVASSGKVVLFDVKELADLAAKRDLMSVRVVELETADRTIQLKERV